MRGPGSRDNQGMYRAIGLVAGSMALLVSTGITRDWSWKSSQYPIPCLIATLVLWAASVWGWKLKAALISLGSCLIGCGAVLFFVMPSVINNGSGQDAVSLFAFVGGTGAALVGVILVLAGITIGATKRTSAPTDA